MSSDPRPLPPATEYTASAPTDVVWATISTHGRKRPRESSTSPTRSFTHGRSDASALLCKDEDDEDDEGEGEVTGTGTSGSCTEANGTRSNDGRSANVIAERSDGTAGERRVLVIYCGGTVGMVGGGAGGAYIPDGASFAAVLGRIAEDGSIGLPKASVVQLHPPLDSSDMHGLHWTRVAETIARHYAQYDGFVVLHGTDTMAYTAAAVSFCLHNLGKPVVFTGAQIPLRILRSDARSNLIDSLLLAAHARLPEVVLVFDRAVLRGNRATKTHSWQLDAFRSPNYPRLGLGGIKLAVNPRRVRSMPPPHAPFLATPAFHPDVALVALYPGAHKHIRHLLGLETLPKQDSVAGQMTQDQDRTPKTARSEIYAPRFKGIVLQAFGSGNAPSDPAVLDALREAYRVGVVIVITSACQEGTVILEAYQTGVGLKQAGCVSAYDMTNEAAFTKLSYLIGQGHPPEVVRSLMIADLAGEITRTSHPDENTFRHHEIVY